MELDDGGTGGRMGRGERRFASRDLNLDGGARTVHRFDLSEPGMSLFIRRRRH